MYQYDNIESEYYNVAVNILSIFLHHSAKRNTVTSNQKRSAKVAWKILSCHLHFCCLGRSEEICARSCSSSCKVCGACESDFQQVIARVNMLTSTSQNNKILQQDKIFTQIFPRLRAWDTFTAWSLSCIVALLARGEGPLCLRE